MTKEESPEVNLAPATRNKVAGIFFASHSGRLRPCCSPLVPKLAVVAPRLSGLPWAFLCSPQVQELLGAFWRLPHLGLSRKSSGRGSADVFPDEVCSLFREAIPDCEFPPLIGAEPRRRNCGLCRLLGAIEDDLRG